MNRIVKDRWQVVSPLLDELLDADETTRAERLSRLRLTDDRLADEVAALLARQGAIETAGFLEGSALGPVEASLQGRVVGSYTLDRILGTGGMGSVWLARRSDGRYEGQAAVKFLNLALVAGTGAERFRREGSVLARLSHPNIARLIDAGVADAQPYLVLEYVEGLPVDVWCDAGSLDVRARVRLVRQVMSAVAHAHAKLILHRDLKPSNILVTADGEAKLLDFGIAKLLHGDAATTAPEPDLTGVAGRAFTPEFAAPEQVQGAEATTATDVHALGVLTYLLLTGSHPTSRPGATPADRLRALVEQAPPAASAAAARATDDAARHRGAATPAQLARLLAGDLDNILARALKKVPAERYPTVEAFAADLQRWLDDEPVEARPDSFGYRTGKFVRRHRVGVAAAAALLVTLVAGLAGTAWQANEARRQRDVALQEIRYSRANHEVLMSLLDESFRGGVDERARQSLDKARAQLRARHAGDPVSRARVLLMLAGRYATINDEKGEADVTAELAALAPTLGDAALRAQISCAQADLLLYRRDVAAARPLVEPAMQALASMREIPLAVMADCYQTDATLAVEQGDFARAVARAEALVARFEREGLAGSPLHLYTMTLLQGIYLDTDREGDVLAMHERIEGALRAQGSLETSRHIQILDRRGTALLRRGRFAEAEALLREVVARPGVPPVYRAATGRKFVVTGATAEGLPMIAAEMPALRKANARNQVYFALFALVEGRLFDGDVAGAAADLAELERLMAEGPAAARERAELSRMQALHALARKDTDAAQAAIAQMQELAASLPRRARSEAMRGELTAARVALARNDLAAAQAALDRAAAAEATTVGRAVAGASAWRGAILLARAELHQRAGRGADAVTAARAATEQFDGSLPREHPWRAAAQSLLALAASR